MQEKDTNDPSAQNAPSEEPEKSRPKELEVEEESPYAQHCRDNAKIWSKYVKETDLEDKEITSVGNSSIDSMLTFVSLNTAFS
jgi:hypothetical protein